MSATIHGATFVIELYLAGAWSELTCDTTSASWSWGAPEALGPLTECEGGTLRVSLIDPDRRFDPENPDSPLLGVLKVGSPMRVTVDGSPAWTGALQTWGWDKESEIADLNALDPIGMLSVRALPEGQTLAPVSATTTEQVKFMLDLVEWPAAKRYFPDAGAGIERGNHYVEGPAIDGLHRIRFAELGKLYPMRDGRIGWETRAGATPPAVSAVICGGGSGAGVGLAAIWKVFGLGRLRNRVVINGGYGDFGPTLPPDEYRTVTTSAEFLQMAVVGGDPLPWDQWAGAILDALNPPPVLTMLGALVPDGPEVAQIVCAEYGARWTVTSPDGDKVVELRGQRVTLAPNDVLEVDAVTSDVTTPIPVKYALMGAGSGYVTSMNTISYANARAGSSLSVAIPSGAGPTVLLGQRQSGGSQWEVIEAFLWFDTSSIPAGATILRASFAAMLLPRNLGSPATGTNIPFTIELRSGYAWRPTLTTADYRPGAGLAALPLRAQWNTANGVSFQDFDDAGSGLAGAIVKGGETQLVAVSARTTVGTAPVDTLTFEEISLQFPRLRVTYALP
jgi:hypothetical protein